MRKKQSGKILCLFVLFLVLAVSSAGAGQVHAETVSGSCGTNATYKYDSSTKTMTISGSGTVKESGDWDDISGSVKYLVIGDKITAIGSGAFDDFSALKSVTLGAKVKSIGSGAFEFCTKLSSVTFGKKLTTIGKYAFHGCTKLKTVKIGTGIKTIGVEAFGWCAALKTVTFKGSAPTFEVYEDEDLEEGCGSAFMGVTATIKYPSSKKSSWTKSLRKMLKAGAALDGGSLTFKTY